jgi:hypothetical protein
MEVLPFVQNVGGPIVTILVVIMWWVDHNFLRKKDLAQIEASRDENNVQIKNIAKHLETIVSNTSPKSSKEKPA